jgi:hypothetical protein
VTLPKIEKAETLEAIRQAFRLEPLQEDEMPGFYHDGTMIVRTGDAYGSPIMDIFESCSTPSAVNAHLFLGHRGCGMSTELLNLKRHLEKARQPVCIVDFEREMNPFIADHLDFIMAIGEGLCKIVEQRKIMGLEPILKRMLYFLSAVWAVEKDHPQISGLDMSGGAKGKNTGILQNIFQLFAAFKMDMNASPSLRETVKRNIGKRAFEWIQCINEMADRIIVELGGKQPVIIFDNVDIIHPSGRAVDVFQCLALSQMPFPVIYTLPISLYYDSRFALIKDSYELHTLPMIKVRNIDRSRNHEGIEAIRKIVGLRANLQLMDQDALSVLIEKTGGSLRDLFRSIISSARRAKRRNSSKIEMQDANSALLKLSSELTRCISGQDYMMLANICGSKKHREWIKDPEFMLKQVQAMVVVEYNEPRWHDVHPLIAEFLAKQGELSSGLPAGLRQ